MVSIDGIYAATHTAFTLSQVAVPVRIGDTSFKTGKEASRYLLDNKIGHARASIFFRNAIVDIDVEFDKPYDGVPGCYQLWWDNGRAVHRTRQFNIHNK